jgi:ketosteroid isomerase-like protein
MRFAASIAGPAMATSKGRGSMTRPVTTFAAGALTLALWTLPVAADAGAADVAQIKALEARFVDAVNAKDVNAIMRVYVPGESLVVFDVVPPRQYVGAVAYRKDWTDFLATLKGPVKFEISDLYIATDRTLGYSHSIQRVSGTDANGKPIDLTVRVTDIYRRIGGHWMVEHEHISVPVDLDDDKPDLASKP